jgi:hypothetical protein
MRGIGRGFPQTGRYFLRSRLVNPLRIAVFGPINAK